MSKNLERKAETFSSKSMKLAAKMAAESTNKVVNRVNFSHALVEETKAMSGYIIEKRVVHANVSAKNGADTDFRVGFAEPGWINVAGKWVRSKIPSLAG